MEFPHLKDTRFPNLDNVNVYSFKNIFDYTRWEPNTQVRLVNVLWDSDYSDVVKFDTNEDRDSWFDSIDDFYDLTLTSNARILPDGQIKLPIPFDVAARYNYLYIDYKYATSDSKMIDYENEHGILRWYFFVDKIEYAAPNTTIFYIEFDVWTNFINDIDIKYMVLERGHAPLAYSDVDEYLSNPISNNKYLLAPDINFGHADVCNNSKYIPFGNGEKYVCFASTCKPSDLSNLGVIVQDSDYTVGPITYSDVNVRYGYQLEVHGFGIGDGYDYSNVKTPASIGASNGNRIANNTNVYAIRAADCYGNGTFFSDIVSSSPSFLYTLQGCFIVSEEMITLGTSYSLAGHTIYEVIGKEQTLVEDLNLEKQDFNYPEKYENMAKLYTYPYAYIEITDNDGKSVEVKIEETSNVECKSVVSLAFPYVNSRIYFDGIGGTGYNSYSWVDLANVENDKDIANSDWFKYCFDWAIPCYALYVDGETAYKLTNFNRAIKNARRSALVSYHNSARDANTARANAEDLATTANTNVYADANTLVTNMGNTTDCRRDNMDLQIATNEANYLVNDHWENQSTNHAIAKDNDIWVLANNACSASADIQAEKTDSLALANGIASLGGMAGAIATGDIGGAIANATSALMAGASAGVVNNARAQDVALQKAMNRANAGVINTFNNSQTVFHLIAQKGIMDNNNACMDAQTDNTNNKDNTNAGNNATTMKNNSDRTKTTSINNAGYTREVAILNAKEILENTRNGAMAALYDSRNARPVQFGSYSGNSTSDYMQTRGIQYKIKTMNDSELSQTGDFFARYGYSLNQNWDIETTGFKLMKNFTYWKATDVWVDDRKSSNNYVQISIVKILMDGVTVWSNPDNIGKVSIYDN